jgi:hypothetical protein
MKTMATLFAMALVFGIGLFQTDAPQPGISQASAKYCFKGGQVYGKVASGVRKSKAKERARKKWRDYAVKLMGTTRVGWDWAEYRGYSCDKKGIWYCRAIATPCL